MEIKGKVHYVGVNDRTKALFENLWPLPYGVSYNSYLIADDDMVALVDTVDVAFFEVYIKKIRSIIGDRKINYLIINHMEPDHSGSIALIKKYYPEIVLVGNKKTFDMVEGYYGVTGERYVVGDGDFLKLGHHNLRFYLVPMVHWPETMVTFDETEGILFSGDAFGCFGALNGGCIDRNINTDIYWNEMRRYYANIVGKFGNPVQRALQKCSGLPIKMICPTHGPVWEEYIPKVVDMYDKMSRYEGEEGVVIAYGTMYGNTEELAETIAEELSAQGLVFCLVYRQLRERESDAFLVEGVIHDFVHVEIYVPVVFGLGPDAYFDIHAAGRQGSQSDERSRGGQDTGVCRNDAFQYGFYFLKVFSIFHSEHPFRTAHFLCAVVGDGVAAQCAVRHVNDTVVSCSQNGMENLDFFDRSAGILSVNVVAHLERLEYQNNQSAGEVRQIS